MGDNTERQFREADAAIARAVAAFMIKIERMPGKWEAVSSQYIVERVARELCAEMSELIDESKTDVPAMLKLSNALADFLDSRPEDR
jgi:hypothetical protein